MHIIHSQLIVIIFALSMNPVAIIHDTCLNIAKDIPEYSYHIGRGEFEALTLCCSCLCTHMCVCVYMCVLELLFEQRWVFNFKAMYLV